MGFIKSSSRIKNVIARIKPDCMPDINESLKAVSLICTAVQSVKLQLLFRDFNRYRKSSSDSSRFCLHVLSRCRAKISFTGFTYAF